MSDIDCNIHYHAGEFLGLPLYLPYSQIYCHEDGSEYKSETALCIGGGSGEHPALVINDFNHCVSNFINYVYEEHFDIMYFNWEKERPDCKANNLLQNDKYNRSNPFDMNQWSFKRWHNVYHSTAKQYAVGEFDKFIDSVYDFEKMIAIHIGAWLLKNAPHLIAESFSYFNDDALIKSFKFEIEFFKFTDGPSYMGRSPNKDGQAVWGNPYPYELYKRK